MAQESAAAVPAPSSAEKGKAGTKEQGSQDGAKTAKALEPEAQAVATKDEKAKDVKGAVAVKESVVVGHGWSLPSVAGFPASLAITNATPCKFHVVGTDTDVHAGATDDVTFETEKSYQRFTSYISKIAELKGWTHCDGISIEGSAKHD